MCINDSYALLVDDVHRNATSLDLLKIQRVTKYTKDLIKYVLIYHFIM